jgi:hypothetical protein
MPLLVQHKGLRVQDLQEKVECGQVLRLGCAPVQHMSVRKEASQTWYDWGLLWLCSRAPCPLSAGQLNSSIGQCLYPQALTCSKNS